MMATFITLQIWLYPIFSLKHEVKIKLKVLNELILEMQYFSMTRIILNYKCFYMSSILHFFLSRTHNEKNSCCSLHILEHTIWVDHSTNNSLNISIWKFQYLPWRLINNHGETGNHQELPTVENKGIVLRKKSVLHCPHLKLLSKWYLILIPRSSSPRCQPTVWFTGTGIDKRDITYTSTEWNTALEKRQSKVKFNSEHWFLMASRSQPTADIGRRSAPTPLCAAH